MIYENFTTYTENDGDIDKTASRATFITMRRDSGAYLYKDYGAGHFGDFKHKFTLCLTDAEAGDVSYRYWGNVYALTDTVCVAKNINDGFFLSLTQSGSIDDKCLYILAQKENGVIVNNYLDISRGITTHYMTIERNGTSGTLKVYSDAARTNLITTLSITCNTTTYQYLTAIQAGGWTSDVTDHISGYIENLDLQEGGGIVETITAQRFPMRYLSKPAKAQELISKVEGATITHTANVFPETLLKKGKAQELRSTWVGE